MYSGLAWMREVFYGVGAAVIGIISISAYKLTIKSVGKISFEAVKTHWLLWLFYLIAVAATVITQQEQIFLFIGCGLLYMIIKAPPAWLKKPATLPVFLLAGIGFWTFSRTL